MARRILHIDFEYHFLLWALVTPLRDYRLCYFLNKATELQLRREKDLEVPQGKTGGRQQYALFRGVNLLEHYKFYLLANRNATGQHRLLTSVKQADYFLMLLREAENEWTDRVYSQLREISHIQTLFKVNVETLSDKQNLIFDDEDILQGQDHRHAGPGFQ